MIELMLLAVSGKIRRPSRGTICGMSASVSQIGRQVFDDITGLILVSVSATVTVRQTDSTAEPCVCRAGACRVPCSVIVFQSSI
jgi:hypothetical protein